MYQYGGVEKEIYAAKVGIENSQIITHFSLNCGSSYPLKLVRYCQL